MAFKKRDDVILTWNGEKITRNHKKAFAFGINRMMSDAVVFAINNHPGWQYRTGIAEGSIQTKETAKPSKLFGLWGSVWTTAKKKAAKSTGKSHDTNYVWYLEFYHGHFLRNAADEEITNTNYMRLVRQYLRLRK